jgi:hypothetical protein
MARRRPARLRGAVQQQVKILGRGNPHGFANFGG